MLLWIPLQRQVRVEGAVERLSDGGVRRLLRVAPARQPARRVGLAAEPAAARPRASSSARWAELDERYAGGAVPRPPHWGGYRVVPDEIEFWQGRANRLHDRFRYTRTPGGAWTRARLAP